MKSHSFLRAAALVALAFAASAALAAGYSIERRVIAGGGAVASGGGYVMRASIAQPVAGPSAAAAQVAWSGFWFPQAQAPQGDHIFRNGFER